MNRLYLLGDSTCADKKREARPETGWGEVISEYIVPGWVVVNCAFNGYSTVSCLKSGTFSSVLLSVKEGDCVIIQFGHNDEKTDERDKNFRLIVTHKFILPGGHRKSRVL